MEIKRWDVVVAAVQGDSGKRRPWVAVQDDRLVSRTTSNVLCPISSDLVPSTYLRPIIEPDAHNGLKRRSQVMTEKIAAVDKSRIRKIVGSVAVADRDRIEYALRLLLGVSES